jgi:acyl carrier protein
MFHQYSSHFQNVAARPLWHKDIVAMADNQDYLDFMYSIIGGLKKEGLELSEKTELVADIGLSSLEVMEFIEQVEDEYDISIPLNILPDISTLGDFARKLNELNS